MTEHHLAPLDDLPPDELIDLLLYEHRVHKRPTYRRLWSYYRNPLDFTATDEHRPYRAAQEQGLPARLTHPPASLAAAANPSTGRREIVIENDIAWRIHTLVDFMFGKGLTIQSLAEDDRTAQAVERVLDACFQANGGVGFFQDMALLGGVYGFVDLLLRADRLDELADPAPAAGPLPREQRAEDRVAVRTPSKPFDLSRACDIASRLVIETVEAPRAIPVLNRGDYHRLDAYLLNYRLPLDRRPSRSFLARLAGRDKDRAGQRDSIEVTEIWTAGRLQVRHGRQVVRDTVNPLGRLPVVHIQNLPQPFFYEGLSEVEPLIPLQDELNTRLSDRANRVTFQSFKMYLGKGIDDFMDRPVGPGQMWATDNPDAQIIAFGGDGPNPSEDQHIREIREAMDKTSAVTAVSAGLLRNKVGNLTSENALRIVMMGLLNRTEKKRITYGAGLKRLAELILHCLDVLGVLPTRPADRRISLHWPSPLPEDQTQRLRDAELKLRIGVPARQVLAELGYTADQTPER